MVEKNNTDIVNLPSEELALLLNQQYQELMRAQNNIGTINRVLESRKNTGAAKEVKKDPKIKEDSKGDPE